MYINNMKDAFAFLRIYQSFFFFHRDGSVSQRTCFGDLAGFYDSRADPPPSEFISKKAKNVFELTTQRRRCLRFLILNTCQAVCQSPFLFHFPFCRSSNSSVLFLTKRRPRCILLTNEQRRSFQYSPFCTEMSVFSFFDLSERKGNNMKIEGQVRIPSRAALSPPLSPEKEIKCPARKSPMR